MSRRVPFAPLILLLLLIVSPASAKSWWDRAGDKIRPYVRAVVPAKLSCIHWTGHPLYIQMTLFMQDNKDELRRHGISNVSSCKDSRDLLIKLSAAKGLLPLAGVSWDLGRCVCERVF